MKLNQYWRFDFVKNVYAEIYSDRLFISIDALAASFPNGVYTTLRTRQSKFALQLAAHFSRLVDGFKLNDYQFPYEINQLRAPLSAILVGLSGDEHKVRLHIPFQEPNFCNIVVEELKPYPNRCYEDGVAVKTNHLLRINPLAKQSSFIELSKAEKNLLRKEELEESLILSDSGVILEGLTSNFFGIKSNSVFTASQNVLYGITRAILLEAAETGGYKIIFKPIDYHLVFELDEAFLTSTSRKVMPVVQIDNKKVGDGRPGPVTKNLIKLFQVIFDAKFESI